MNEKDDRSLCRLREQTVITFVSCYCVLCLFNSVINKRHEIVMHHRFICTRYKHDDSGCIELQKVCRVLKANTTCKPTCNVADSSSMYRRLWSDETLTSSLSLSRTCHVGSRRLPLWSSAGRSCPRVAAASRPGTVGRWGCREGSAESCCRRVCSTTDSDRRPRPSRSRQRRQNSWVESKRRQSDWWLLRRDRSSGEANVDHAARPRRVTTWGTSHVQSRHECRTAHTPRHSKTHVPVTANAQTSKRRGDWLWTESRAAATGRAGTAVSR